jgi:hypothetical protein
MGENKMRIDSLSYELGVMMFNTVYGITDNRYDILDNFIAIIRNVEFDVDRDRVYEGYIAESDNRGVSNIEAQKALEIFYFDNDIFQWK